MKLLITQLQNQNPLEPMDNSQMTAQLAQISQLEQMENLNGSFSKVLLANQLNQATSLMGKQISFLPKGSESIVTATVDAVRAIGGEIMVQAGTYIVDPAHIQTITQAPAPAPAQESSAQ